eukprot:6665042-Prymnesium_polylepis.2
MLMVCANLTNQRTHRRSSAPSALVRPRRATRYTLTTMIAIPARTAAIAKNTPTAFPADMHSTHWPSSLSK